MSPLLLLLLLGCPPGEGPPGGQPGDEAQGGGDGSDSGGPEQVGSSTGDEIRHRRCSGLYDPDALLQFELDIPDDSWAGLESDFRNGWKNYHPATFTWEEETREVQVRLKGNPSFSWLSDKLQFVISFNEDDADARFHGVRKIALDATWYEPTLLRDVTPEMLVARDETFGPVAPLFRFSTEQQAIEMANDTKFGLAAYFYARDIGRVWRVSEGLEYGIEDFTELKYLCLGGIDQA